MTHIPFTSSETLAKNNPKNRSESHHFFPACNHLTKEDISDWFKIVLRGCILSEENLMHFHIKLILFPKKKMKSQLLLMQKKKNVDYFQLFHKCQHLPGKGKDFHFLCCCYIGLGELRLSCTFPRTQWKIRRNGMSPNTIYQYRYSVNIMYNEHRKIIPLILTQLPFSDLRTQVKLSWNPLPIVNIENRTTDLSPTLTLSQLILSCLPFWLGPSSFHIHKLIGKKDWFCVWSFPPVLMSGHFLFLKCFENTVPHQMILKDCVPVAVWKEATPHGKSAWEHGTPIYFSLTHFCFSCLIFCLLLISRQKRFSVIFSNE